MRTFLLSLSDKTQATFIIGSTLILAFLSASVCSLFFDVHQLITNTDLISSVYQVMGTVYAILLTFTLWGVWQNFIEAGNSVQNEANALLDLVHTLEASSGKNSHLRKTILTYTTYVVEKEWSTLKNFTSTIVNIRERNHSASMEIVKVVQAMTPKNEKEIIIFDKLLDLLANWLNARRARILIARGNSVKALWPVLLIGAIVLFAFNGLFVAKTLGIWSALLFGISLVIGVTFYLIFSLDCPFSGSLSIDSEPFSLTIDLLQDREIMK